MNRLLFHRADAGSWLKVFQSMETEKVHRFYYVTSK